MIVSDCGYVGLISNNHHEITIDFISYLQAALRKVSFVITALVGDLATACFNIEFNWFFLLWNCMLNRVGEIHAACHTQNHNRGFSRHMCSLPYGGDSFPKMKREVLELDDNNWRQLDQVTAIRCLIWLTVQLSRAPVNVRSQIVTNGPWALR